VIVFHGTADYVLALIEKTAPLKRRRCYVPRESFCTTTERKVAELFAIRKTGCDDFKAGKITGIVLEFELVGEQPRHWDYVRDPRCMLEEHEVAVYDVRKLTLLAVWRLVNGEWHRNTVERITHGRHRTRARKRLAVA
jgi:hypothetical protein